MKPRTVLLLAGTVGAGMVLTNMMRGRRHEHKEQAEGKQSHRGRNALALLGVGALLAKANRRRRHEREEHKSK